MINIFQRQKNDVGGRFFRNGKKIITKNDEHINEFFFRKQMTEIKR